jgi:hypothetical protein
MIRRRSVFTFWQGFVVTCWKWEPGPAAPGRRLVLSAVPAGVGSGLAEERGESGDGFEQLGLDAGLLVGVVPGLVFGDGAAMLGLEGELADPGGHGRVDGRAARAWVFSRG